MINRELIRLKVLQLVYAFYQNGGKAMDVAEKELEFSLAKGHELYNYLLSLLVEVQKYAERKQEAGEARAERLRVQTDAASPEARLAANKFLMQLCENKELAAYRATKPMWEEEPQLIKKLYEAFVSDEAFSQYLSTQNFGSYEADRELIRKLYKNIVEDNEEIDAVLEDHSLYWNDDKPVVDSFVLKTIRRFRPASDADEPLLPAYASEEDHTFAIELFHTTIERAEEIRELISTNVKNWEFNRLAFMDVIIMQMALAEILHFPSIPLNVSFNEYLDMAKIYSTPRSAGYINGLLDSVVKKLRQDNKLMK